MGRVVVALVLAAAMCGCSAAAMREPRAIHVVVAWLKKPGDEAARRKLIMESKKLGDIPGVVRVSAGTVIPSPRPMVDSSFDVVIVMTFRSSEDLERYPQNPRHQEAVKNVLGPLVERYIVYDIQEMDE